jgi:hypothetical protein
LVRVGRKKEVYEPPQPFATRPGLWRRHLNAQLVGIARQPCAIIVRCVWSPPTGP